MARTARKPMTERARAERKLGLLLVGPAALVMLAVTAYPILYAVWLSLRRSDLRFPDQSEFVGLENYVTVLGSSLWWSDVGHTVRFKVQAKNAGGSTFASSVPSAVVVAAAKVAPPTNTSLPTVSGTPQQGKSLTGSKGSWSPCFRYAPAVVTRATFDAATSRTHWLQGVNVGTSSDQNFVKRVPSFFQIIWKSIETSPRFVKFFVTFLKTRSFLVIASIRRIGPRILKFLRIFGYPSNQGRS